MIHEQELIAAVLSQPALIHELELKPEYFHSNVHAEIWRVIERLSETGGQSWDAVTVSQECGSDLGARVISIVNESVGSTALAKQYAQQITTQYRDSKARAVLEAGISGELDRDGIISALMSLDADVSERFEYSIDDAMRLAIEDMEDAAENYGKLRGITTGLADLDKHTGGFHKGDLVVIGARPAMGKTALLLHHAAAAGVPVGLISAEQPAYQVAQRHIAAIGKVPLVDLRRGAIDQHTIGAFGQARERLGDYWIYDRSAPSVQTIMRVARRWKHQHGIKALYVDYIQRIEGRGNNRVEQVGHVTRSLKTLARDLEIPVIALSQVKRDVEARPDKRPRMGDLSDSSEIEKEADMILTLYRDEVYSEDSPDKGTAELRLDKNRHGYVGSIRVDWRGEYVAFGDLMRDVWG